MGKEQSAYCGYLMRPGHGQVAPAIIAANKFVEGAEGQCVSRKRGDCDQCDGNIVITTVYGRYGRFPGSDHSSSPSILVNPKTPPTTVTTESNL